MQKVSKYETAKRPDDQRTLNWNSALTYEGKKRHRRTAGEIDRHYRCPFQTCLKSYGYFQCNLTKNIRSEGSLSQHIKIKHKGEALPAGAAAAMSKPYMGSEQGQDF